MKGKSARNRLGLTTPDDLSLLQTADTQTQSTHKKAAVNSHSSPPNSNDLGALPEQSLAGHLASISANPLADLCIGKKSKTPPLSTAWVAAFYKQHQPVVENGERTIAISPENDILVPRKFNTKDDPMREATGSGIESNPEEIQEIINDLEASGVEIQYRSDEMAYAPGLSAGKPGQFKVTLEASYSAWMHEYKHFIDDRSDGFTGMRVFQDTGKCKQREIDAYNIEIGLAKKAGRPDIAERLERLKTDEVSRYD
jgi:hypothetical protein